MNLETFKIICRAFFPFCEYVDDGFFGVVAYIRIGFVKRRIAYFHLFHEKGCNDYATVVGAGWPYGIGVSDSYEYSGLIQDLKFLKINLELK